MLSYPNIDPVAISIGPLSVHWYGLMYMVGFAAGWWLGRLRVRRSDSNWTAAQMDDLLFYAALGIIIGGRLGYALFYDLARVLEDPLTIIQIWKGGMSFHGGLIGVMVAMWLHGRRYQRSFFQTTDFIAPLVPIGLGAGRIGNFINGELWGGPTSASWGMQLPCRYFPDQCEGLPAGSLFSPPVHPSQLYEAALEGLALFLILWFYSSKPRPTMAVSGLFLLGYGLFRFVVEFVRLPDTHIGYLAFGWVTMGQVLTLPMIIGGIVLIALAYKNENSTARITEGHP
jgi:phosphatidylglycerol:prolipoprotein diacylglycerol transferase